MDNKLSKPFLLLLVVFVLVACYLVFKPFLIEIIIAAVLVSILYRPYNKIKELLFNNRNAAALIMCLLVIVLIVFPLSQVMILAGKKSVTAYNDTVQFFTQNNDVIQNKYLHQLDFIGLDNSTLQNFVIDLVKRSSDWMVSAATFILKGTTSFFVSLFLIIFAMFFFFRDGEKMLRKLMLWSPLQDKYNMRLFKKFQDVSYSTIISTFVTAFAQGLVGAIGYMIIGMPAFFPGILIGFTSLLPYVGSILVYVPTGIYLLLTGQIWQGVFMLLWGSIIIGNTDNIIRTYMIQGKAHVNPVFVFFSIMGGIVLFGFWGVVLGPLIISIAITVFHIYELEYGLVSEAEIKELAAEDRATEQVIREREKEEKEEQRAEKAEKKEKEEKKDKK
ncbi:MAG: AI-2E family transporter [Candidatus Falkowbacteria bacterium]